MLSQRGQLLLIFKIQVLKTSENIVWPCTKKGCSAIIYTQNSGFSTKKGTHNHNIEEKLLLRQKTSNSVNRKTQKDISAILLFLQCEHKVWNKIHNNVM
jgi:hypothetical protein